MRYGVVLDPAFENHSPPGNHPENPQRIAAIGNRLRNWERFAELVPVAPLRAQPEWITAVHSQKHFRKIEGTLGGRGTHLDPDTWAGPDSFETALLAAGSVVGLLQALGEEQIQSGFALVRPPGHHAEKERAMGFCLFNNIAVGADWALANGLATRVAIVDFDVHHGNGTQQIFYSRGDVLYVSTHQYPYYPGGGHFRDVGEGDGIGHTVNIPLSAGAGDKEYEGLFTDLVSPILLQFRPQLILVSAGFDAHRDDPLAGMELTTEGFTRIVNLLNRVAAEACQGRILYVLEGGYHLEALAECVCTTIATTLEPYNDVVPSPSSRSGDYRKRLGDFFSTYWTL